MPSRFGHIGMVQINVLDKMTFVPIPCSGIVAVLDGPLQEKIETVLTDFLNDSFENLVGTDIESNVNSFRYDKMT